MPRSLGPLSFAYRARGESAADTLTRKGAHVGLTCLRARHVFCLGDRLRLSAAGRRHAGYRAVERRRIAAMSCVPAGVSRRRIAQAYRDRRIAIGVSRRHACIRHAFLGVGISRRHAGTPIHTRHMRHLHTRDKMGFAETCAARHVSNGSMDSLSSSLLLRSLHGTHSSYCSLKGTLLSWTSIIRTESPLL